MAILSLIHRELNPRTGADGMLGVMMRWCVLLVFFAPCTLRAQSREYQIKAAFIYNFAQFVQWPASAFTNASQPFEIGILGDNPFGKSLEETVKGETIKGRPIIIVEASRIEKLAGCQILFVSKSASSHVDEIFPKLNSQPVLTVGEDPGFLRQGGIINLYRDGPKVHFEINPDAAERSGLKLGSELLSVGKVVRADSASK